MRGQYWHTVYKVEDNEVHIRKCNLPLITLNKRYLRFLLRLVNECLFTVRSTKKERSFKNRL